MYCNLIKKINVTKSEKLSKIAANAATNFIGIGGSNGFVQVVNFDTPASTAQQQQQSSTSFSQTLEYHTTDISLLTWNSTYNKLTTCDTNGVMIVWRCANNKWDTEMINKRDDSFITCIKWSKQGHLLCFTYDDGHAIVGTVEGLRSWGNDIRNRLYLAEWSPDGSALLLAAEHSNVIILSSTGQQLGELSLPEKLRNVNMAAMTWWTNCFSENNSVTLPKHLMLAFVNGVIALYDDHNDLKPLQFNAMLESINCVEWNVYGDLIAVSGKMKDEGKYGVALYTPKGEMLKLLKMPENVVSFTWDAYSTKLLLQTQSTIYLGLVKPKHKWCYFLNTVVYSYLSEQDHHTLVFWDTKTNKQNYKYVKNMLDITACSSFCLITAKISDNTYLLILTNSIGSPVDNKIINIEPKYIALNSSFAVASDGNYVYLWQFRGSPREDAAAHKTFQLRGKEMSINLLTQKLMRELCFFIDDPPNLNDVYNSLTFQPKKKAKHAVSALALTEGFLFAVCNNGKGMKFNLCSLTTVEKFYLDSKMLRIGMSPDGRYLWCIDEVNVLSIWDTEQAPNNNKKKSTSSNKCTKLPFERKDVWNVQWSDENELTFCFLEKNRLNIIKRLEPEEVLTCNGYLAEFRNLNITTVKLDELLFKPPDTKPEVNDFVIRVETRVLRDLREHIRHNIKLEEIYKYVDTHSNRKLWELFLRHALTLLDFPNAEKALIHMNDYMGLCFLKRLKSIDDDALKQAEVAQFFEDYDEAESLYIQNERSDLAIAMRLKLGQWERVIALMHQSGIVKEDQMKIAYTNLAQQYLQSKDFQLAGDFFNKAGNIQGTLDVCFATEDFATAATFIEKLPEQNELLLQMAEKFEMFGLCEEAVKCYLRYGDAKRAIDTCVMMNRWNLAVELAEKNNFFQIEALVNKFGSILMEKNKKMDLVELYRKAHRHTDAARILVKIAEDFKELKASPLTLKKIHVVAALEMESFKSRLIDAQITNITQNTVNKPTTTLDTLITSDLSNVSDKTLNNPWKGAEAYHFYMLCQAQLYQNQNKAALKTALRLVLYEKELGAKEVYRLIALSAYLNGSFKECSKALSKLEHLNTLNKMQREAYRKLSIAIFTKERPVNRNSKTFDCPNKKCDAKISEFDIDCKTCGSNFSPCVVSGQSVLQREYFKCKRCKHKCLKNEVYNKSVKYCPLCHVVLDISKAESNKDD